MGGGPLGQNPLDPRSECVGRAGGDFLAPGEEGGLEVRAGGAQGPLSRQGRGQSWSGG